MARGVKKYSRKKIVVTVRKTATGQLVKIKCQNYRVTSDDIVLVKSKGYGVENAVVYPRKFWSLQVSESPAPKIAVKKPKPEPVAVEEPLPPVEVPEPPAAPPDEFSDEDMEVINGPDRVSSTKTGDLGKEYPGEYNARIAHDKIGANDLMKMKAHVESNYALQEGQRKIQQAKAKRLLTQNLERLGVGCIPD